MENTTDSTKEKILIAAQLLIQTRGYNAFSYADISTLVNIRKASIHYYFPSKVDLGIIVTRRYRDQFADLLNNISNMNLSWLEKIKRYADLYKTVLNDNRICLCGALASDIQTLPSSLQHEVRDFFNDNVVWLANMIPNKSLAMAKMIISTLQGAMIFVKTHGENRDDLFSSVVEQLLHQLSVTIQ